MTLNNLARKIRELQKQGYGGLQVEIFAHDHDPECVDEGDGQAQIVDYFQRDDGSEIIGICA